MIDCVSFRSPRPPARRRIGVAASLRHRTRTGRILPAGTVLAAVALAAVTAGPAVAADPILPLSEVRPGMTGTAHTVVRGTTITQFPVTVTDVQPTPDAPGGALILIRAEGPLMAETGGIAEGMSGSPVYVTVDGVPRVIGAIAYGQGDEQNVLGGVTPIERMVGVTQGARALSAPRASRPVRVVKDRAAAVALGRRSPGVRALYPLQRWSAAGFSRRLGATVRSRIGGGAVQVDPIATRSLRPPVPLVPGASMTALVMGGDLVLGALGTVTYTDGGTVVGFGHPFTGAGATRYLLGDGYVYNIVAAPIRGESYKLGEPGTVQGMLTGDRRDGVVGRVGPVDAIEVVSRARDTRRETSSTIQAQLAAQPELAPAVSDLAQIEPLMRVRDGVLSGTLTTRVVMRGGDLPRPVVTRNVVAAVGDVSALASGSVSRPLAILMQNSLRGLTPGRIEIDQTLEPEVRAARIVSARILPRRPRAGQRVRLQLRIQPWRGNARVVTVPARLPEGLYEGPAAVRVVPNDPAGFDPTPADLTNELGVGQAMPLRTAAALRGAERTVRALQGGSRAQRVVRAIDRLTLERHDAVRILAPGDEAEDRTAGIRIPVPGWVISGGRAVVRLTVR
jgi:hypothetical protein